MPGEHRRGAPTVAVCAEAGFQCGVDDVEQFAELNGEAHLAVGRDVAAVTRHDKRLLGRQQGVEQEVPALGMPVTLADARPDGQQVVAVDGWATQAALVEAEQAHDLGGDVAYRGTSGERHGARAQAQPPAAVGDDAVDDREHVVERQQ